MKFVQLKTQSRLPFLLPGFVAILFVCSCSAANVVDPLASWNEGPAKQSILEFVAAVTDKNGKDYVEPAERIAVFDHDGLGTAALRQWLHLNSQSINVQLH